MLLPSALRTRLAEGPGEVEPLPVVRHPAAGAAPFRFAAHRVRFSREHEFFEDGDVQRHLYLRDVLTQVAEAPERPRVPEFTCQVAGCCQVFDTLESYEHHYHVLHSNVCSFCKRAFPSGHLLDSHILEWHDALFQILAERQDMYQCLVEGCEEKFKTSQDRKDHMVKRHLYPADFRFDKPKKSRGESLPTSLSSAGQLHRGPQCLCQPKSQRVTVSSQKGTPWRSAPTDTWRPPQCLRERAWPHQGSRGSGPTATEFLPPSVSVKVRHGDLKAPRREANTTDGPSAGGEPEASDTSQGAVPPSGGGFGHGLPFSPWDRAASSCGVATLGPRPRLSLMSQPVVGGVRYQEQQELVAPDGDADHCPGRRWILALGRGRHENLVFECVK